MGDKQKILTKELLTVNNIRFNNKVNILSNIVKSKDITRNDLARENQISIMTVKHIVDELIEDGIIEEHMCKTLVGRKPMALNISKEYGNVICVNLTSIDVISYIIYNIEEKVLAKGKIEFPRKPKPYKDNLLYAINKVKASLQKIPTKTIGIAVFVPSAYYEEQDLVNYDLIADFKDLHIKEMFRNQFNVDNVLVLHDAFAAAMSEYESANTSTESQFYFYCGSGVGGFMIYKGVTIMGEHLVAGEVGKMILSMDADNKKVITLEDAVAIPSVMEKINRIYPNMKCEEAFEKYGQGDKKIQGILNEALDIIAKVLYNILWIYNPTKIIVDSYFKQYSYLIKQRAKTFIECFKDESIPIDVEICLARYDEYHMMRGCFKLALEKWIEEIALKGEAH